MWRSSLRASRRPARGRPRRDDAAAHGARGAGCDPRRRRAARAESHPALGARAGGATSSAGWRPAPTRTSRSRSGAEDLLEQVKALLEASTSACGSGSRSRAPSRSAPAPAASGSELLAQVADVELDLVARDAVRVAPDELEQLVAREHLVRVLHERREQLELERRQLHLAALDGHAPLGVVDLDEVVGVRLGHLGLAAGPAQERLDAGEQLLAPERLRDVVVGARRRARAPSRAPACVRSA